MQIESLRAEVSRLTAALARFETEAARELFGAADEVLAIRPDLNTRRTDEFHRAIDRLEMAAREIGRERLAGREGG